MTRGEVDPDQWQGKTGDGREFEFEQMQRRLQRQTAWVADGGHGCDSFTGPAAEVQTKAFASNGYVET